MSMSVELAVCGVYVAARARREELAAALVADGIAPADVAALHRTLLTEQRRKGTRDPDIAAASLLAQILTDPENRAEVLAAVRIRARRAEGDLAERDTEPGADERRANMDDRHATEARRRYHIAGHVYCRLYLDGHAAADVAADYGLAVADLPRVFREGARNYGWPDPEVPAQAAFHRPRRRSRA